MKKLGFGDLLTSAGYFRDAGSSPHSSAVPLAVNRIGFEDTEAEEMSARVRGARSQIFLL